MSARALNIFFTGATGYIGGSILLRLLEHPKSSTFRITALVRSLEKAQKLESIGVKTIIGDYSNLEKLETSTAEADYVFAVANSDNEPANNAILSGLKKRFEKTGKAPVLIHTSGIRILADNAMGMYASDTIYSDTDVDQIESRPSTQIRRPVDLAIVAADEAGYVKTYIVLPSVVYGLAKGRLVDLGIQKQHAILIKILLQTSLARNSGFTVGEGKNIWSDVDIEDCADLYIVLFNAILEEKQLSHGREGFYFAENDEYSLCELSTATTRSFYELGLLKSDKVIPLTEEEMKRFGPLSGILGGNARCRANRSRALGWKPTKRTSSFFAGIKDEVKLLGYTRET